MICTLRRSIVANAHERLPRRRKQCRISRTLDSGVIHTLRGDQRKAMAPSPAMLRRSSQRGTTARAALEVMRELCAESPIAQCARPAVPSSNVQLVRTTSSVALGRDLKEGLQHKRRAVDVAAPDASASELRMSVLRREWMSTTGW